jgi:hypothetical protein
MALDLKLVLPCRTYLCRAALPLHNNLLNQRLCRLALPSLPVLNQPVHSFLPLLLPLPTSTTEALHFLLPHRSLFPLDFLNGRTSLLPERLYQELLRLHLNPQLDQPKTISKANLLRNDQRRQQKVNSSPKQNGSNLTLIPSRSVYNYLTILLNLHGAATERNSNSKYRFLYSLVLCVIVSL